MTLKSGPFSTLSAAMLFFQAGSRKLPFSQRNVMGEVGRLFIPVFDGHKRKTYTQEKNKIRREKHLLHRIPNQKQNKKAVHSFSFRKSWKKIHHTTPSLTVWTRSVRASPGRQFCEKRAARILQHSNELFGLLRFKGNVGIGREASAL